MADRAKLLLRWTAVAAAVVWLGSSAMLALQVHSGHDLVLLRNAIIAEVGPSRAYDWTPADVPGDFDSETRPAPEPLQRFADDATAAAEQGQDFDEAVALAAALSRNRTRGRGAIQSDTVTALRRITTGGAGYCADYTQVFNALAPAAGLEVREWGMSFDGYGGDGHAFNEVWDDRLGQWVFIDSFFSFYVTGAEGRPLSATELRAALLQESGHQLRVVPINPDKFGFKSAEKALEYYRRGAPRFFMIWGNNVLAYDAEPAVRAAARVSRAAEQLAGIAIGVQPRIVIPADFADAEAVEKLSRLRALLILAAVGAIVAVVALLLLRAKWT